MFGGKYYYKEKYPVCVQVEALSKALSDLIQSLEISVVMDPKD